MRAVRQEDKLRTRVVAEAHRAQFFFGLLSHLADFKLERSLDVSGTVAEFHHRLACAVLILDQHGSRQIIRQSRLVLDLLDALCYRAPNLFLAQAPDALTLLGRVVHLTGVFKSSLALSLIRVDEARGLDRVRLFLFPFPTQFLIIPIGSFLCPSVVLAPLTIALLVCCLHKNRLNHRLFSLT